MITKQVQELTTCMEAARLAYEEAEINLSSALKLPENNVFEYIEDAEVNLHSALYTEAEQDCEGSYTCGNYQYEREFMVDGVVYTATLDVEYNRHDKTYYFIEDSEFSIAPKQ